MKKMNVLIACEESQTVCKAFREKGHNAFSCDIQEPSGGHPEYHILGDVIPVMKGGKITTMDEVVHDIDHWDLMIAHPECFVAGTKVMTYEGIKSIEDVKIGDLVLTHKGRYRKVTNVMSKSVDQLVEVHTENCGRIKCTPNHPFYVQNIENKIVNRKHVRNLKEFEWLPPTAFIAERDQEKKHSIARDRSAFKKKTYTTTVTDSIEKLPEYNGAKIGLNKHKSVIKNTLQINSKPFWYLVGRWMGDGWFYYQYSKGKKRLAGIRICCGKHETQYLKAKIQEAGFSYTQCNKRTADIFEIANKELGLYMTQFGEHSYGKFIPGFAFRLPKELAESFINGYMETDGYHNENGQYWFSTVSANLAYGLKYMINKYYKVSCSIKVTKNHNDTVEGRKCHTRLVYAATFSKERKKQARYLVNDQYILSPFRTIQMLNEKATVYNLSVEEDESYTANGVVVHNCTHLAVSGSRFFEKKRADGRQRQGIEFFCKFLESDIKHIAIENPVGIISGDYVKTWFPDLCEKYGLPRKYTQIIQPYEFGHPVSKKTCLWLKNLPPLVPTNIVEPEIIHSKGKSGGYSGPSWLVRDENGKILSYKDPRTAKARSKTYGGIAQAMADQWGSLDDCDE